MPGLILVPFYYSVSTWYGTRWKVVPSVGMVCDWILGQYWYSTVRSLRYHADRHNKSWYVCTGMTMDQHSSCIGTDTKILTLGFNSGRAILRDLLVLIKVYIYQMIFSFSVYIKSVRKLMDYGLSWIFSKFIRSCLCHIQRSVFPLFSLKVKHFREGRKHYFS